MFDVVSGYSRAFNVKFRSDKCQVPVIDDEEDDGERKWKLGGKGISLTNEYRYLACVLSTSGCEKVKNEEMFRAQQWYERLGRVTRFRETGICI